MPENSATRADISVVLNLYKRPEALALQLQALALQTLPPKEILLFQDGTDDATPIAVPQELKSHFTKIVVSSQNVGVWGRFKFARETAQYPLVCVFDDDTIPGRRWLENCNTQMQQREGIYGTIGIVLEPNTQYPYKKFFRVGWDGQLCETAEVDFVGHSWFFKKSWLDYMYEVPSEVQSLKCAGEDIALSFGCQQHGIKTFVPPHPPGQPEWYGSQVESANSLGTANIGISMNTENLKTMNHAIQILLKKGWSLHHVQAPLEFYNLQRKINRIKWHSDTRPLWRKYASKIRSLLFRQ